MPRDPRRTRRVLLVVVMVLFINLPLAHSTWTRWRVERSGAEVTAEVVDDRVLGSDDDPQYWVLFRFPERVDPERSTWSAEVDRLTYETAVAAGEIDARVLEDQPAAYQVEGQVRHWFGLVTTLVADLALLAVVGLAWRYGRRTAVEAVRISAVSDLEACPPGAVLEQVEGSLYLVRGEVSSVTDEEVVLHLGDREVVVVLDGHRNPVGLRQPAQVRGRLIE